MKDVHWQPLAERDLKSTGFWYATQGGMALELRFVAAVEKTITTLRHFPEIGSARHKDLLPDLTEPLRFFPVSDFDRHLIYYVDYPSYIKIIRVWHSAQGFQLFADDDSEHLSS